MKKRQKLQVLGALALTALLSSAATAIAQSDDELTLSDGDYHVDVEGQSITLTPIEEVPTSTTTAVPTTVATTSTTVAPATTTTLPATTTTVRPTTTTAAPTTTTTQPATTTTQPPPGSGDFLATFETPGDFFDRFQRQVFFGTDQDRSSIPDWLGDHDMGCAAPPTVRVVHSTSHADDAEKYWWCAPAGAGSGHVMTSMYTEGYAQVDFAPNQAFTGIRRICWDQNMTTMPRKWIQVIVVPEVAYLANGRGLHYGNPDLQPSPAEDSLHLTPSTYLLAFTNGSIQQYVGDAQRQNSYFESRSVDDKARRYTQCMTDNENGSITYTNLLPNYGPNGVRGDRRTVTLRGNGGSAVGFPNDAARVIFQDDTYDAFKTDLGDRSHGSDPRATWHWDNICIETGPLDPNENTNPAAGPVTTNTCRLPVPLPAAPGS